MCCEVLNSVLLESECTLALRLFTRKPRLLTTPDRLDPELDWYRKMLAMLQDRRLVHQDRVAQKHQRREYSKCIEISWMANCLAG